LKVIEREGWTGTRTILGRGPAVEQGHELGDDDDDDEMEVAGLVLHELRSVPLKLQSRTEDGISEE